MLTTGQALKQFAADYSKAVTNKTGFLPQVRHDQQWRSVCEQGQVLHDEMVQWQWQMQPLSELTFSDVETALELSLHPDIEQYYCSIYCGSLFLTFEQQQIELLQVWNQEDFARLCQNIIGHILMQRRLKQRHTVFIGCVTSSEYMISVDIETGEVIREVAGNKNTEVIASSLAQFFAQAQVLVEPEPEQQYQAPKEVQGGLIPRLKEIFNSLRGR